MMINNQLILVLDLLSEIVICEVIISGIYAADEKLRRSYGRY